MTHTESLLKNSPEHWRAAYALSQELVKEFYHQNPSKLLTPDRLISFTREIITQGLEDAYITRDSDISQVLSSEKDSQVVEEIFLYAAKHYPVLIGS